MLDQEAERYQQALDEIAAYEKSLTGAPLSGVRSNNLGVLNMNPRAPAAVQ